MKREKLKLKRKYLTPDAEARSVATRFQPGNPGKPAGVRHLLNKSVKECILEAAARLGSDGKGRDGLVGFMMSVGRRHPTHLLALIGKVLPLQLQAPDFENHRFRSIEEVQAELRARGIPVERIFMPDPKPLPSQSNGRAN